MKLTPEQLEAIKKKVEFNKTFGAVSYFYDDHRRLLAHIDAIEAENKLINKKHEANLLRWQVVDKEFRTEREAELVHKYGKALAGVEKLQEALDHLQAENENLLKPLLPTQISRYQLRLDNEKLRARVEKLREVLQSLLIKVDWNADEFSSPKQYNETRGLILKAFREDEEMAK